MSRQYCSPPALAWGRLLSVFVRSHDAHLCVCRAASCWAAERLYDGGAGSGRGPWAGRLGALTVVVSRVCGDPALVYRSFLSYIGRSSLQSRARGAGWPSFAVLREHGVICRTAVLGPNHSGGSKHGPGAMASARAAGPLPREPARAWPAPPPLRTPPPPRASRVRPRLRPAGLLARTPDWLRPALVLARPAVFTSHLALARILQAAWRAL